jgi:hypothetical protein
MTQYIDLMTSQLITTYGLNDLGSEDAEIFNPTWEGVTIKWMYFFPPKAINLIV